MGSIAGGAQSERAIAQCRSSTTGSDMYPFKGLLVSGCGIKRLATPQLPAHSGQELDFNPELQSKFDGKRETGSYYQDKKSDLKD